MVKLFQSGGSNLTATCAVFTSDSRYLCVGCGNNIKVLSVVSGECTHQLLGHTDIVTCLQPNPNNILQVISSSEDGTLKFWDYKDGVLLKTYDITPRHVTFFYPLKSLPFSIVALLGTNVVLTNIRTQKKSILLRNVVSSVRSISLGCQGQVVAAIQPAALLCYSLDTKVTRCHALKKSQRAYFTTLVCHPTKSSVITGSSTGKIHVWHNVMDENVVMAIYHWHHCEVNHLAYSADGSYLLSGGAECVLVKWQFSSDTKDFLPRLEAPIQFIAISPDNTTYALTHADNAIQLVSSSFTLLSQYQGVTRNFFSPSDPIPTGLVLDPKTGALVFSGRPGHLQFYDVSNDKQLYNLDITGENYVTSNEADQAQSFTAVTRAAFGHHGYLLATVEVWQDVVVSPEIRLKFWHDDEAERSFVLNTCVDLPHNEPINCLEFRPTHQPIGTKFNEAMLVTTSNDGKFKLWTLVDDTDIYRENLKWSCDSVGFYRNLPATMCSFSYDGSVLAVVFACHVTLWDPDSNALRDRLTLNVNDEIRHIKFGNQRHSHYLISCSKTHITLWNILSCSAEWSISMGVSLLIQDIASDIMAVVASDAKLFYFHLPHPHVTHIADDIGDIVSAIFIPHSPNSDVSRATVPWQQKSQLYFMTRSQNLFTFSDKSAVDSAQHTFMASENLPLPPMALFISETQRSDVQPNIMMNDLTSSTKHRSAESEFFTCSSHLLPPPSQLSRRYVERFLNLRSPKSDKTVTDDDETFVSECPDTEGDQSDMDMSVEEAKVDSGLSTNTISATCADTIVLNTDDDRKLTKKLNRILKFNYDWLFEKNSADQ